MRRRCGNGCREIVNVWIPAMTDAEASAAAELVRERTAHRWRWPYGVTTRRKRRHYELVVVGSRGERKNEVSRTVRELLSARDRAEKGASEG